MKFIIVLGLLALVAVAYNEDFICDKGVTYKENGCNLCHCSSAETFACTKMGCRTPENKILRKCEKGTAWTKDCNRCWCIAGMGTVCENKNC